MNFTLGLNQSAKIYCDSTITALNQMEKSDDTFIEEIKDISEQLIANNIEYATYSQVVEFLSKTTERWVLDEGWELTDINGVCWMLGKLCKAYSLSLRKNICPFEKIFKDCFIYYFEKH